MYYFTADEHYNHKNIIKYCKRPFISIEEMNEIIINNHNSIVSSNDTTIHAGDFVFCNTFKGASVFYYKLNGSHIFIKGSHDKWMNKSYHEIWEKTIDGIHVVVCHYPMLLWGKSHYGSIQLFGHVHKTDRHDITLTENQMNIGVDTNNFYPYSFDEIKKLLKIGGVNKVI